MYHFASLIFGKSLLSVNSFHDFMNVGVEYELHIPKYLITLLGFTKRPLSPSHPLFSAESCFEFGVWVKLPKLASNEFSYLFRNIIIERRNLLIFDVFVEQYDAFVDWFYFHINKITITYILMQEIKTNTVKNPFKIFYN